MNKKNIALGFLGALLLTTGTAYYLLVERYDKIQPKVIFEKDGPEKKLKKEKFILYIPDDNLEKLKLQEREAEVAGSSDNLINLIFELLKSEIDYKFRYRGESGDELEAPFLDEGVKLLNTFIDGQDVYLNFNYNFKENMKTPQQELLIVYSIVNSITQSAEYKRVKILVNNKEIDRLNFYRLSKFYEKNLEI
ncbi:GerMN domain-containing protein [uncultured Ilyobacter sp.]|uniref:GerMN domain-containing protein n=1 Tax=uncultured Ilyobacter sp. TaxID=544433 RepID=UPI0029C8DD0A|nr:GerMN domain-containing protein [uncultured Ilyobacter sp.]